MMKSVDDRIAQIAADAGARGMSPAEMMRRMKALYAEHAADQQQHQDVMRTIGERQIESERLVAAMLRELIEMRGDRLEGDGYITRKELCGYFGDIQPATLKSWGENEACPFPAPLGGWNADGEKRHELRFRKTEVRAWRAMMHGVDQNRAVKLYAAYEKYKATTAA